MAGTESNKSPAPLEWHVERFSWRVTVFAVLCGCRSIAVDHANQVIDGCIISQEGTGGANCKIGIFFTPFAVFPMFLGWCCAGFIARNLSYDIRFNWRAAVFAVSVYGRYFGEVNAKNITDQCILQDGNDAKCGAYIIDIISTLCLLCYVGYFVPFLVSRLARGQYVKLGWRARLIPTLFYFSNSGAIKDIFDCIFEGYDGGKAIKTASTVLLICLIPQIGRESPRYHTSPISSGSEACY
jgi:hypothetical protein